MNNAILLLKASPLGTVLGVSTAVTGPGWALTRHRGPLAPPGAHIAVLFAGSDCRLLETGKHKTKSKKESRLCPENLSL